MTSTMNTLASEITEIARSKGFFSPSTIDYNIAITASPNRCDTLIAIYADTLISIEHHVESLRKNTQNQSLRDPIYMSNAELLEMKLVLVATELGEAIRAIRKLDAANFAEECADVLIRMFHIMAELKIDIDGVVREKMEKNKQRPFMHGKIGGI